MGLRVVDKPNEQFDKITGIDYARTKKGGQIFRALNHKLRQSIIQIIHENKRLTVTEIYEKLDIAQPVASQQLLILRRAKIVTVERDGRSIWYSINYPYLDLINKFLDSVI